LGPGSSVWEKIKTFQHKTKELETRYQTLDTDFSFSQRKNLDEPGRIPFVKLLRHSGQAHLGLTACSHPS
jgi:hypothetical protein